MRPQQTLQRRFFRLAALGALASTLACQPSPAQGQASPVPAAEPIRGMIGVGTWTTQAEFKDIKVTRASLKPGSAPETLFASDFSKGLTGWKANSFPISGNEGFLIIFGSPGDDTKSWWNIGGFNNTVSTLEMPGVVVPEVPGKVETGRWHDLRVELRGTDIRCYFDGALLHDTKRIRDAAERNARIQQILSSPGFRLLNAEEQSQLRTLFSRPVYLGRAAVATFGAMPGSGTFSRLNPLQQWMVIRKVGCNRLTWQAGEGFDDIAPDRKQAIVNAMDEAVMLYNSLGIFDHHLTANNSPGIPTADGNINGQIRFGGQFNNRAALHEIGHCLGIGQHEKWGQLMVDGVWTGPNAKALLAELDGAGAVLHGDKMHFWPYGLNQDSEASPENNRRHVRMVAALRRDMGIHSFQQKLFTIAVPSGAYRLTPRHAPGKALAVQGNNPDNGAFLVIWDANGQDAQKFLLDLQDDATYRIRTALPGNRAVELPNGETNNGTQIQLWDDNGNPSQRWYLIPLDDTWFKIAPKSNINRSMDVDNLGTENGTFAQIWDYQENLNQQWKLTPVAPTPQ